MKKISILCVALLPVMGMAQKNKVQSAWRALSDYEGTVADGKPDVVYLNKAKEAIDLALANEETKNQAKTHAYNCRINYALYQNALRDEQKKLEATVTDKNERTNLAYGNVDVKNLEIASQEIEKITELDPKFMNTIFEGMKGTANLTSDDIKLTMAITQIKQEAGNVANGKYKVKKYEEASDYFYKLATLNSQISGGPDTASFYNACVAAAKSKNESKILEYNKKMIVSKIASPYNYETMYNTYLSRKDTSMAMDYLKKGREKFPNDANLMNKETDYYLAKGKSEEALANLSKSLEKDPNNAVLHLVTGNIYDNLANPKDKATGKDLPKPAKFDEYFAKAETHYKKAIELKSSNVEYYFSSAYNLGAMYNNYGGYLYNTGMSDATIAKLASKQKEIEAKSNEYYKKAIPYLEQALSIKGEDKASMSALRKLYLLTGDAKKAEEMTNKLKGGK